MVLRSGPQIAHRPHLFLISDEDVLTGFEFCLPLKKGFDELSSAVIRCIIDDDNVIIGVILHGDGFNILKISSSISIVEGRHDNAKGKFSVLIDIVLRFIILPLFFRNVCLSKHIPIHNLLILSSIDQLLGRNACKDSVNALGVTCGFDFVHGLDDGADVAEFYWLRGSWVVDGFVYLGGLWDFELHVWVVLLEIVASDHVKWCLRCHVNILIAVLMGYGLRTIKIIIVCRLRKLNLSIGIALLISLH